MRKCIYIITLALWGLLPSAKADEGVILLLNDGTSVGFAFSKKPVITTAETLTLTTSTGERVSYDYKEVKHAYFGDTSTGIKDVRKDAPQRVTFHVTPQSLRIEGLSAGERVTVYTTGGQRVTSALSNGNGTSLTLDIPAAGHTVYIVKTSTGVSFKFSH